MQSAAKVGVLVVIFVALLFGAYAVLGRTIFAPKMVTYYAIFQDVAGIQTSSPVLLAGVKVGNVDKIELAGPREAKVTISLKEGTPVPTGSVATIPGSLIGLGETPFLIQPPETSSGTLPPGSTLKGIKQGPLDSILPNSKETLGELNKTIVAFRKILEDEGFKKHADQLLASSQKTIDEFGKLAGTTNSVMTENRAEIKQALVSANDAIKDVHRITNQVALELEKGTVQKDVHGLLAQLKDVTGSANKLVVSMDNLVNDPELRNPVKTTVANVAEISETGKSIATNTKAMTEQGVEISKNVNTITQKAIPLMDSANEVMTKASKIEDQLQDTLGKVGGFFNRPSGPSVFDKLSYSMDLIRHTDADYWRTDIGLEYPFKDGRIYAGLFDAFGSNKLTLQLGKSVSPKLQYRYGIYAGKPGIGVDYEIAPKLSLHGDLWDINRTRSSLAMRYDFGNGFVGWAGMSNAFGRNSAIIGVGIRR